jgi:hypothetical protein
MIQKRFLSCEGRFVISHCKERFLQAMIQNVNKTGPIIIQRAFISSAVFLKGKISASRIFIRYFALPGAKR